jgi:hypothetical protein
VTATFEESQLGRHRLAEEGVAPDMIIRSSYAKVQIAGTGLSVFLPPLYVVRHDARTELDVETAVDLTFADASVT